MALRDPALLERTLTPQEALVLADFVARVRGRFGSSVARLVLFGSRARGDVDEDSDIDVLVLLAVPLADEAAAADAVWEMLRASKREHAGVVVPLAPIVLSAERAELAGRRLGRDLESEGILL